jgi:archaellum biogenesis protein FlaJ (TadC family)
MLIGVIPIALLMLIPISLYSSVIKKVQNDQNGVAKPVYLLQSRKRQRLSRILIIISMVIIIVYLLITQILDTKAAYEFSLMFEGPIIGPFTILLPIGFYLAITNQCPYCCKLNSPKETNCVNCHNPLEDLWIKSWMENT